MNKEEKFEKVVEWKHLNEDKRDTYNINIGVFCISFFSILVITLGETIFWNILILIISAIFLLISKPKKKVYWRKIK